LGYAKCLLKAQNGVVSVTRGENGLLRYGFAVLAVGAAFAIKLLLDPLIVQESPFLLILGAIMISAWYGGLGPGLLATVAAGLATDYWREGGPLRHAREVILTRREVRTRERTRIRDTLTAEVEVPTNREDDEDAA
jgi:hypothetical protein